MLLEVLLACKSFAADVALEWGSVGIMHVGVAFQKSLPLKSFLAHSALEWFVLGVSQEVVLHVALVGELLVARGAGEGLLLVLPHVVRHVLSTLEAFVTHLAGVGHDSLPSFRSGASDSVVSCRARRGGCGFDGIIVVLQMVAEKFYVLCPKPAFVALKLEHEIGWVRRAFSSHQVFTTGDALVVQVPADGLPVHGVTKFFNSPQAIVEVHASLMSGQHVSVECIICSESLGTNVTLEHSV